MSSKYDAILIPGGGIKGKEELPIWAKRRLDRAIKIYKGEYVIILSAGTIHKPLPLDNKGFPIFESSVAANYLIKKGINPNKVLKETFSYDTIGNAYFSRVVHVDPGGFRKLLIITSEFHMPRTKEVFEWVYNLDASKNDYELCFEQVTDEGIDEELLRLRREKEQKSLEQLRETKKRIHTLKQFHDWLFTEHSAYAASIQPKREEGRMLESY